MGFHDFVVTTLDETDLALATLHNKVVLVVNTASACGFTPQLAALQALWHSRRDQGLVVLGFPCNQFGGQEPGSAIEIADFCTQRYSVDFPLMAKVDVNGSRAAPLFVWLKAQAPGWLGTQAIKWNFTKFLVGRDGRVLGRYAPHTRPEQLRLDVDRALLQGQ
ncbi:glutathione peroxidase [Leptothrix ochracea L12]|uniref:Glutathione peroxidase n=1 Tax=Leptothrix ochracea L12 TaxID=735332 RepID=I4Z683_9BURK|nr:glutathione peroxidase [Leptothrix ochracea]EIM31725.1 glutathione peroxidase [Leptothrix ochracea L12]